MPEIAITVYYRPVDNFTECIQSFQAQVIEDVNKIHFHNGLQLLERHLTQNGGGDGWFVGNKVRTGLRFLSMSQQGACQRMWTLSILFRMTAIYNNLVFNNRIALNSSQIDFCYQYFDKPIQQFRDSRSSFN